MNPPTTILAGAFRRWRRHMSLPVFWTLLTVAYCAVFVTIDFSSVPAPDLRSVLMLGGQWLLVSICCAGVLGILSASRILFAITFPILMAVSVADAFYTLTIGVGITPVSMEIALVNGPAMWATVIDTLLLVLLLAALLLGAAIAVWRWKRVGSPRRVTAACVLVSLVLAAIPFWGGARVAGSVGARLPYSIYFSFREFLANYREATTDRRNFDSVHASAPADAPDVLVVLGESLRADHLPQNGYSRNTMPLMSADSAAVSFPHVYTEPFHTFTSLPRILTDADSLCPDAAYERQSFITLFRRAGFRTAWFANQDINRSYAYFAHEADTLVNVNSTRSFYSYAPWLDADLLAPLAEWFDAGAGPRLAVVHTIGSHWWYKSHYTPAQAVFLPDIRHKDLSAVTPEEMINAYDNTIIATDSFLHELTRMMLHRPAVIIFISDHGECLGENGTWLHASDAPPLHYPACIIWTSPSYARRFPDRTRALRRNASSPFSTDNIFHTALHAASVTTAAADTTLSLMR